MTRRTTVRLLTAITVLVLVGGAISVGVAEGLAWRCPEPGWTGENASSSTRVLTADAPRRWLARVDRAGPGVRVTRQVVGEGWKTLDVAPEVVPYWSGAHAVPGNEQTHERVTETAYGWPWPVVRYEYDWHVLYVGFSGQLRTFDELRGGLALSDLSAGVRVNDWRRDFAVLPLRPIWPSLAASSVTYAAALGGLLLLVRWPRRHLRRRRGQCVRCGYPRPRPVSAGDGGGDGDGDGDGPAPSRGICSECGTAVR